MSVGVISRKCTKAAKRGMSGVERSAYNTWSGIAIVPAIPFAMSELLPPQVWQAISILIGAAR